MVSGGPNLSKMAKVSYPLRLETEQSRDLGDGCPLVIPGTNPNPFIPREQHQSLVRLPQSASPSAEHLCDPEVQP